METHNSKKMAEHVGLFASTIKNIKFIITTLTVIVIFGVVIFSGDGKQAALNFYKEVTGQKYELFEPIQDKASEPYLILKAKLNQGETFADADVTVFQESDSSFKYRLIKNHQTVYYRVRKKQDGVWQILKL